jgi:hypothetical protein
MQRRCIFFPFLVPVLVCYGSFLADILDILLGLSM